MTLQDVIRVVGDSSLVDFPWGKNVILLVNSFVHDDHELTISSNGTDLLQAIDKVESDKRPMLLAARVILVSESDGLFCANGNVIGKVNNEHMVRNVIMISFTVILCAIALLLTFNASQMSVQLDGKVDTGGLMSVVNVLAELFKALAG